MQILAAALPGLRDIRAPLTAGYLWVVFVWMMFTPNLTNRPTDELLASLYDLAKSAGPIWVGIATGTIAYILGSVTQMVPGFLVKRLKRRIDEFQSTFIAEREKDQPPPRLAPKAKTLSNIQEQAREQLKGMNLDPTDHEEFTNRLAELVLRASIDNLREVDSPATLLVVDEPLLFAEVDRLRAEGDLRLTIALPLAAIVTLLSFQESWWWASAFWLIAALTWQGVRHKLDCRRLIIKAFKVGRIESPSVKGLQEQVDGLLATADARRSKPF